MKRRQAKKCIKKYGRWVKISDAISYFDIDGCFRNRPNVLGDVYKALNHHYPIPLPD